MAKQKGKADNSSALVKAADTEVEAYGFIRERLGEIGWIVKDPARGGDGQVWTQNQCLAHGTIKRAFATQRPENIIKLGEQSVWIVEAKATRKQLDVAVSEAIGYAKLINDLGEPFRATVATGVAGNESDGYDVKSVVLIGSEWHPLTINGQQATGFLSPSDARYLSEHGGCDVKDFAPSQRTFLRAATRINEILHYGGIEHNERAKTIAALLLAVLDRVPDIDASLPVLIRDINTRSGNVLRENDKPQFERHVEIIPPTSQKNHVKYRSALIRTIMELQNLNIRSAMNSSTDVLGQFYEVFLKYGNGAKEIGIVLTPRHVTRFAVEAVGVTGNDIVLDPACGTGGFLVAAFDHVRRNGTTDQLARFKRYGVFGIEESSTVALLAIVNMIFRGDGKHNITEGNCLTTFLGPRAVSGRPSAKFVDKKPAPGTEPVTRVLMNPPFAKKGDESEYLFVDSALQKMSDGGLLFALLPLDCMFGAGKEKIWRERDLLGKNTLLAALTLPAELFYPTALKQVVAIIVKKGFPHKPKQPVFWARIAHDGHLKVKSKRLPASELVPPRVEPDQLAEVLPHLQAFLAAPNAQAFNVPTFYKTAPVDYADPLLELLPEAYLDAQPVTQEDIAHGIDALLRETASFLIRFNRETMAATFDAEATPDSRDKGDDDADD